MRTELTSQFIKKTIKKIVIFAFIMVIVTAIVQSMSPVVSNEMALTQMQNSNEMFVMMNTYNKVKPIANAIYAGVVIWFTYTIGRDIYKFSKTVTENNIEKEN